MMNMAFLLDENMPFALDKHSEKFSSKHLIIIEDSKIKIYDSLTK